MVPEDRSRFIVLESLNPGRDSDRVVELLREDFIVAAKNFPPEQVDAFARDVTARLGLQDSLETQATFATSLNRERVGKFAMTVNRRGDYQFIAPHSEGYSSINVQFALFYCFENSTDGGETIFMNVDDSSDSWKSLRERTRRLAPGTRRLTSDELRRATGLHGLGSPPFVAPGDEILREYQSDIPGVAIVEVLALPQKTPSTILDAERYSYWASIANCDRNAVDSYVSLLKHYGLLREPEGGLEVRQMDTAAGARVWSSGIDFRSLFKCVVLHKLERRDLVFANNRTWAHAVSNWTPGRGTRQVVAAFA
jgi:hypothetical protein